MWKKLAQQVSRLCHHPGHGHQVVHWAPKACSSRICSTALYLACGTSSHWVWNSGRISAIHTFCRRNCCSPSSRALFAFFRKRIRKVLSNLLISLSACSWTPGSAASVDMHARLTVRWTIPTQGLGPRSRSRLRDLSCKGTPAPRSVMPKISSAK